MIQRIQTVYLLIATLCISSVFIYSAYFLSVAGVVNTAGTTGLSILADNQYNVQDNLALEILAGIAGAIAIICIFLYKNRKLQIQLTNFLSFLILAIFVFIGWTFYQEFQILEPQGAEVRAGFGLIPLAVAVICFWLANKAIHKDEKLVRSADRLR